MYVAYHTPGWNLPIGPPYKNEVELELVPFALDFGVCVDEGVRAKKPDCFPPAPAREGKGRSSKSIRLVSIDFMLNPLSPPPPRLLPLTAFAPDLVGV